MTHHYYKPGFGHNDINPEHRAQNGAQRLGHTATVTRFTHYVISHLTQQSNGLSHGGGNVHLMPYVFQLCRFLNGASGRVNRDAHS